MGQKDEKQGTNRFSFKLHTRKKDRVNLVNIFVKIAKAKQEKLLLNRKSLGSEAERRKRKRYLDELGAISDIL